MVVARVLLGPVVGCVRLLVVLLNMRRVVCALSVGFALLVGCSVAFGQTVDEVIAQTGLDRDLVAVLTVDAPSGKFLMVAVYVNERTVATRMQAGLAATLPEFVGRNAVLVWAYTESGAAIEPGSLLFAQDGSTVTMGEDNVFPVTGDLREGVLPPRQVVASIIVLGDAIDPTAPFTITYGEWAATLAVEPAPDVVVAAGQESPAQPEGLGLTPEPVPGPPASDACCDPCAFLCGWWRQPCQTCAPCDPCEVLRGGLMFLLLLLGQK